LKQTDQLPISTKPLADGAGHTFSTQSAPKQKFKPLSAGRASTHCRRPEMQPPTKNRPVERGWPCGRAAAMSKSSGNSRAQVRCTARRRHRRHFRTYLLCRPRKHGCRRRPGDVSDLLQRSFRFPTPDPIRRRVFASSLAAPIVFSLHLKRRYLRPPHCNRRLRRHARSPNQIRNRARRIVAAIHLK